MRRRGRFDAAQSDLALQLEARVNEAPQEEEMEEDRQTLQRLGFRQPGL